MRREDPEGGRFGDGLPVSLDAGLLEDVAVVLSHGARRYHCAAISLLLSCCANAVRVLKNQFPRVFFAHLDGMVRPHPFCQIQPGPVQVK